MFSSAPQCFNPLSCLASKDIEDLEEAVDEGFQSGFLTGEMKPVVGTSIAVL